MSTKLLKTAPHFFLLLILLSGKNPGERTTRDFLLYAMHGKLIVIYGINNLGKSTQARLLVERLQREGHKTQYLKYPIYDLAPSGHMLNQYLREDNPFGLSAREAQLLYVLNRTQAEPAIKKKLKEGIHIVAEDYIGTGLAWGIGAGVDEAFMKDINSHLLKEDLVFLFKGERFVSATETNHKHESDQALLECVAGVHERLGKEYGWIEIAANDPIETIAETLWATVRKTLEQAVHGQVML
ncbi:MAG TPA: hypothetical protein DCY48_03870 [Candidatus Magasanikbacteria bacterium]|nr:hypothetical protein [Candidatus Magasanikbacteria bacterium]